MAAIRSIGFTPGVVALLLASTMLAAEEAPMSLSQIPNAGSPWPRNSAAQKS